MNNYSIIETIFESSNSIIYRAVRKSDNLPVVLKYLNKELPVHDEIVKFTREYDILKQFNEKNIIKAIDIEEYNNSVMIILEDFNGISINKQIKNHSIDIFDSLLVAYGVANALEKIHNNRIIHKDINSNNILYNKQSGEVKVIDFNIATKFNSKEGLFINSEKLEGTLAYISPEQTGRMNCAIDFRTDFYSLGISLYEMLTQTLPFISTDQMELVHAHIAKVPVAPHIINSEIPEVVSQIVLKLLSKNVSERYQSAYGLKYDLEKCIQLFDRPNIKNNKNQSFEIATRDYSSFFSISTELVGRKNETEIITAAFDRISSGNIEIIFISGKAGTGKSELLSKIRKNVLNKNGIFVSGKFDEFHKNIPYFGIISAFKEFTNILLSAESDEIEYYKKRILKTVGNVGKVLTDFVPAIELIIGKQPDLPELGGAEAQNRFNYAIKNFLLAVSSHNRPIVLFLDDLQLADNSSFDLIFNILSVSNAKNFLFIGAFRDNELTDTHPLTIGIEEVKKIDSTLHFIELKNLSVNDIEELIINSSKNQQLAKEIAPTVLSKTQGIPFFVHQFLMQIYYEGLLKFNFEKCSWECDVDKIEELNITDNVIELLTEKINRLSDNTKYILKIASCIGLEFEVENLKSLIDRNHEQIANILEQCKIEGIIISDEEKTEKQTFKFVHHRIHEATYSLLESSEKEINHLKNGQYLLKTIKPEELESQLFNLVNQLNLGINLISKHEKEILIELNFKAGIKAKTSAAYNSAIHYFLNAYKLLDSESWQKKYGFTLKLHNQIAEVAYLCLNYEKCEEYITIILKHAQTVSDKYEAYKLKILLYKGQGKLKESVETGLEYVSLFDIKFPKKPNKIHILKSLVSLKWLLRGKKIEQLLLLPENKNSKIDAIISILTLAGVSAYFSNPLLSPLLIIKRIKLNIKNGNSPVSALTYSSYGLLLCGILEDMENGYKFGRLAINILDKLNSKLYKGDALFRFHMFICHWSEPVKNSVKPFLEAYKLCLETGEIEFASNSLSAHFVFRFMGGFELAKLYKDLGTYHSTIKQLRQSSSYNWYLTYWQTTANLLDKSKNAEILTGEIFDEEEMEKKLLIENDKSCMSILLNNILFISFLLGNKERALQAIEKNAKYLPAQLATPSISFFHFYNALFRLSIFENLSTSEKKENLKEINLSRNKFKKWSKNAPSNFLHKYYVITAEKYRILKQHNKARELYDKAVLHVKESGNFAEIAIIHELAGKFYLSQEINHIGSFLLFEAYQYYQKWGAIVKVKEIEKKYPHLFLQLGQSVTTSNSILGTSSTSITKTGGSTTMDLISLLKASQALSGEINLAAFLEKLIEIIIENAGAQKALIVENKLGKLLVQAKTFQNKSTEIMLNQPLETSTDCSHAVVNFVARSKDILVIDDAINDINYTTENYIKENKVRSILCYPVINKGHLSAIIYLENNLTVGAFTESRIEILKLLSTQITTSIENALLYESLEEKVKQRTEEVVRQKNELEKLSIAVSKTDNAIIIMDTETNFEWVNEGFTRIYGYDIDTLISELGENLFRISTYEKIESLINICKNERRSVTYESISHIRGEKEIWTQTTITPIFDENGKIYKLIAIDSDISKLKEFEKQILEKNQLLNQQNENINASIRYAQTIQNSILPDKTILNNYFENFIIYKPKDIVSGDFYWFHCKDNQQENLIHSTIFVAVVDCTGHGVPGAFMSLIGFRLINEIVNEKKEYDPATILELLNTGIRISLHQDTSDNIDGMDICLCRFDRIDEETLTLTYSGAKSPLYFYRSSEKKVELLKSDRKAIGGVKPRNQTIYFSNKTFNLKKGDTVYLSSDGFIDQNNSERKRFGTENFISLLNQIATLPMDKQKHLLEKKLTEWKQTEEQRDDITVLGIKI